jgi:hypothetical protein
MLPTGVRRRGAYLELIDAARQRFVCFTRITAIWIVTNTATTGDAGRHDGNRGGAALFPDPVEPTV